MASSFFSFTAVLLLICVTLSSVQGYSTYDDNTITLSHGLSVVMYEYGPFDVSYEVTVDSGHPVNVYVMNNENFNLFSAGSPFEYLTDASFVEVYSASLSNYHVDSTGGKFWVVISNPSFLHDSEVTYSVTFDNLGMQNTLAAWALFLVVVGTICCLFGICLVVVGCVRVCCSTGNKAPKSFDVDAQPLLSDSDSILPTQHIYPQSIGQPDSDVSPLMYNQPIPLYIPQPYLSPVYPTAPFAPELSLNYPQQQTTPYVRSE